MSASLAQKLENLGLKRALDFVLHLPLRYEDETRITPVSSCVPGETAQVDVYVAQWEVLRTPRPTLTVQVTDASGDLTLRFLHFYPSQMALFQRAQRDHLRLRVRGELRRIFHGDGRLEMIHPRLKIVQPNDVLPVALTPVYPTSDGISQNVLRKRIEAALTQVELDEVLPSTLLTELQLMPLNQAIKTLHYPPVVDNVALLDKTHPAWTRIKFEELLAQQLSLQRAQQLRHAKHSPVLLPGSLTQKFRAALPFTLTRAQTRVASEISLDLQRNFPMTRLLQGDVGAGKTIVAALAAVQAVDAGYQVAFMAPTEILAEQHFRKMAPLLAPLGVQVAWLTGSLKAKEKRAAYASMADGTAQLTVGTHALFQEASSFAKLGLVIIDEQHRFGVAQRLALRTKAIRETAHDEPHQLMMSATPIPRTLAMSYLADLDVSIIDELPPGRTPVLTKLIENQRRDEVITRVREAVHAGRQVYWVCPLIEESEALQLQTAVETYARLSEELVGIKVGLIHGRLSATEKHAVMESFVKNEVQVLVATTVIEVGVDVANASLMIVEHAERFGLSQLHQLRGRVGRGARESVCVLLYAQPLSAHAKARLRILHQSTDGFDIAQRDLALRGPGEFLGARQSGTPLLRFADLEKDGWLVERAQQAAKRLWQNAPEAAQAHLERWLAGREEWLKV